MLEEIKYSPLYYISIGLTTPKLLWLCCAFIIFIIILAQSEKQFGQGIHFDCEVTIYKSLVLNWSGLTTNPQV